MARDTFSVPILHIYSSVGYCVVYFCLGFVRAFYQIDEIDSTLLVFYKGSCGSWRTEKT